MINKKLGIAILIIVFVLAGSLSYIFFAGGGSGKIPLPLINYAPPSQNGTVPSVNPNEPKTEECPINGEMLTKSQKNLWEIRRPLGVMIENHKDARPQSGLSSADVVYEAVAEGGITRFLAIFYCKDAPYVGPVRSARVYFIQLLEGYGNNPLYAHVGGANTPGDANALGKIDTLKWSLYNDLNQFAVPFPYYWRDYERLPGVVTEHTVYSATAKLWQYAKDNRGLTNVDKKGIAWNTTFTPWKFQDDSAASARGDVTKISFGFWNTNADDYSVTWNYDATTNSYARVNGGVPHLDKNTGKSLTAKDVVVIFTRESVVNDGYEGGQHLLYGVIGSGNGLLFQNGKSQTITWKKSTAESAMMFYNTSGSEVKLVRGEIFVEILPIGNKVTY